MSNLAAALRIAINGIQTSQLGLGTVAHNIANADTDGYHRQTVEYSSVAYDGFGSGVQLEQIERQVDEFLQTRLTDQISEKGYTSEYLSYLEDIESIFGDPTDQGNSSLDKLFNSLFNELSDLANNPDSSAQKSSAVQQAVLLADTLQNMNSDLGTAQARANDEIDESIENINVILKNIYKLNQEIAAQETSNVNGANANDLRDQRQEQIDMLAEQFKIQVTEESTGAVRILTENGRALVDVSSYSQLERTSGSPYDGIGLRRVMPNGELSTTLLEINTDTLTEGSIKALIDVRDEVIPDIVAQLDNLTNTFMDEFNRLHSQGSSYPPVNALTSANTYDLTNTTDDLYANLDANLAGATFNISVVDSTGDTVYTTMNTGLTITGTGPVTLPAAGPFSLADLETLINNNVDIGNTTLGGSLGVTATAGLNSNGDPVITIAAADSNLRVVLSNASGDALGSLGMNNFFTGTGSSDIAVRSDIQSSPSLVAFAQMRSTDGGLSSLNNDNALQLAALSETELSFSSAGGLPSITDSITGYTNQILANFAVDISDASDRNDFADTMLSTMRESEASVSGVNIDEELAQMLIYQNAFQASSRIIATVDELLQTLIQTVG